MRNGTPTTEYTLRSHRGQVLLTAIMVLLVLVGLVAALAPLVRANEGTLSSLPGIDQDTVNAILAWRSPAAANAGSTANSGDTYQGLPQPYQTKAAPFDSVEELLLVQGVTPSLLYGPQGGGTL